MTSQRAKDRAEIVRAVRTLSRYVDTGMSDDGSPMGRQWHRINTDAVDDGLPDCALSCDLQRRVLCRPQGKQRHTRNMARLSRSSSSGSSIEPGWRWRHS
jgi:hypothetical protein